jgi:membrane protein DedA with SNARE-associated domain
MSDNRLQKWLPLVLLAGALLIWAGLFAAGAYFEPSADRPRHDIRKPLVILAAMAAFLAFWGVALWWRNRRKGR